ncbi:ALK and LTK ligand 2-like [Spinachia spinachia]
MLLLLLLLLLFLLLAGVRPVGTSMERESRSHQRPEELPPADDSDWAVVSTSGGHRDPRHKEKFIKHLTGRLHFSPKCRKHFYRLYHNTRDCTTPDYYKRCARLLTRLANSPHCTER